jgi:uncharacterized repeat protein (TIGR01451 family)
LERKSLRQVDRSISVRCRYPNRIGPRSRLSGAHLRCIVLFLVELAIAAPAAYAVADLTITKTHIGSFTQGDAGKSYTISVKNIGDLATSGTVDVIDTLPAGLAATAMSGTGWTCTLGTLTCTRNDALAAAAIWPPIVVTVNVASNAPFAVTNIASVSGGGELNSANSSASDRTVINTSANCGTFAAAVNYGAATNPNAVAVGDFNGDGKADLAIPNGGANNVSILLGNGDGTFAGAVNYGTGLSPNLVAIGDFDGDGKSDLAVVNQNSNTVSILLGNGNGTFAAAVNYGAGNGPASVAVGDFNGDGNGDLVVANVLGNNVSILLGNGNGTFSAAVNYATSAGPYSVALGDFNGDGKGDVAVAGNGASSVSILLGNGDGTFAAAVNYGAGSAPTSVVVGDFNGDGKGDLAVANSGSNNVSILLGNGNGTFAAAVNYAAGSTPWSVAIGDFNGDGKADFAVANFSSNNVSIAPGNGDGTFAAAVNRGAGAGPTSVAIGDFNGDGKGDLAIANNVSNNVSILPGACPDLTIVKTHSGNFSQGQSGAIYTLTVNNAGTLVTQGLVTVTDNLPASLTATGMSGTGWSCNAGILTCTRSDALNGGGSYPDITLTVSVSTAAPSTVTNTAAVSGSGESTASNNTAGDPTNIIPKPDLTITKTHAGNFAQGQSGRTYSITVGNAGTVATNATVTVNDPLPTGLTATAMTGIGWSCTLGTLTCTRNDALAVSASFPPITLTVNVNDNAPATIINTVSVSGGGEIFTANDSASDPATIIVAPGNFSATAVSTSQVNVTWSAVVGATSYRLFRSSGNSPFLLVGSPSANNFTDPSLAAGTTYVYFVRAFDGTNLGLPSQRDLATTILFADDPVVPASTLIKAVHITELRAAVNAVRAAAGLPPATFTDAVTAGLFIKIVHITELRSNLDEARSSLGLAAALYMGPTLAAGDTVMAAHIQDLREGVR